MAIDHIVRRLEVIIQVSLAPVKWTVTIFDSSLTLQSQANFIVLLTELIRVSLYGTGSKQNENPDLDLLL